MALRLYSALRDAQGYYETGEPDGLQAIIERSPVVYFPMRDGSATDISGHDLHGTINGTPAGSSAGGIDLGGTAHISLAHSANFSTDPGTADQDVYSEALFVIEATVNTLVDNTAIWSKCDNTDAFANGVWAVGMADGRVIVNLNWVWKKVSFSSPPGTISQGVAFKFAVGLGYDGAWASVNGRMLNNGDHFNRHWYGLNHRVRDVARVNASIIRIGRVGSAGVLGDITVRDFAVFLRNSYASRLQLSDAQAIAGESGPVIDYAVWGASTQNIANGASAATVQSAIDARSAAGGGTVKLAAGGVYTWSASVTMKHNVRLDLNGSAVTITAGQFVCGTTPSFTAVTDDGGNLGEGATSITGASIASAVAVGDILLIVSNTFVESLWGGTAGERISEIVQVRAKAGNTVHFSRPTNWAYTSAGRLGLWKWTPTLTNAAVVGGTIQGNINQPAFFGYYSGLMVKNLTVKQTGTAAGRHALRNNNGIGFWSPGGFRVSNVSDEAGGSHVYTYSTMNWDTDHVIHRGEFWNGGVDLNLDGRGAWHALAHWGNNSFAALDSKGMSGDCEYVGCKADTSDFTACIDAHYTSFNCRFVDCRTDASVVGASGTGGGGISVAGHRHEILRFTQAQAGKGDHLGGTDGVIENYWRDCHFIDNTTANWFGYGDYGNSKFVNLTRVATSTPGAWMGSDIGGNTFINVDDPHPV